MKDDAHRFGEMGLCAVLTCVINGKFQSCCNCHDRHIGQDLAGSVKLTSTKHTLEMMQSAGTCFASDFIFFIVNTDKHEIDSFLYMDDQVSENAAKLSLKPKTKQARLACDGKCNSKYEMVWHWWQLLTAYALPHMAACMSAKARMQYR